VFSEANNFLIYSRNFLHLMGTIPSLPYLQQPVVTVFTTACRYRIYNSLTLSYLQQPFVTVFTTACRYPIYNSLSLPYLQQPVVTVFTTACRYRIYNSLPIDSIL
jgi:hypothetical protein